jgi:hypothetical protein
LPGGSSSVTSNGTNSAPNCGIGTGGTAPIGNGTATAQAPGLGSQDAAAQRGQTTGAEEPLPAGQVSYNHVTVSLCSR